MKQEIIKENTTKLEYPIKVYFSKNDYDTITNIANENGLSPAQFIRNEIKKDIKRIYNENNKTLLMSISREEEDNKDIFNSIILKLGFCEIQLKNTMLNEQKDLILSNIKELIDNLLNLLKEKQKQKYKDILYSMLDYNISIQDIAKMKLEKYLK